MYKVQVENSESNVSFENESLTAGFINQTPFELDLVETREGCFHLIKDNKSYQVDLVEFFPEEKQIILSINGKNYKMKVQDEMEILLQKMGITNTNVGKVNEIKAPMPGLVINIAVSEGQTVEKNQQLFVLEAMKMENNIKSPIDGVVGKILCEKGKAVEKNQLLLVFA